MTKQLGDEEKVRIMLKLDSDCLHATGWKDNRFPPGLTKCTPICHSYTLHLEHRDWNAADLAVRYNHPEVLGLVNRRGLQASIPMEELQSGFDLLDRASPIPDEVT